MSESGYDKFWQEFDARAAARRAQQSSDMPSDNVVDLAAATAARKPKPLPSTVSGETPYHIILGSSVVDVIQARGEDLMFIGKTAYWYSNGLWTMETDGLASWLNVEIEKAAKHFRQPSTSKLINEARAWIQRQEHLCRKTDVAWDAHGLVPTKSGLVNPRTGECRPMRPDDYCTWRIEADYDPTAVCPWWLQMLEDVFADRSAEERADTIGVIQELLGVGLIDDKPRELSRCVYRKPHPS